MIIRIDEEIARKNEIDGKTLIAYSDKFNTLHIFGKGFGLEYLKDSPKENFFGVKRTDFKMPYPEYIFLRHKEVNGVIDEKINETITNQMNNLIERRLSYLSFNGLMVYANKEEHLTHIGFKYGNGFLVDEKDLVQGLDLLIKDNMKISQEESSKVLDFILQQT